MKDGFYIARLEHWEEKTVVEIEKVGEELQVFCIGDDEAYLFKEPDEIYRRGSSDTTHIEIFERIEL